jgi:hypothetical protein
MDTSVLVRRNSTNLESLRNERAVSIDDDISVDVTFVLVRSRVGTKMEVPRCASNYIREELIGNERLKDTGECKGAKFLWL